MVWLKDKKTYNILAVEDNSGDFFLIEEFLRERMMDVNIYHATDFRSCLKIIRQRKQDLDVILIDLTLPDKSGYNLVKDVLAEANSCPVIVLTGHVDINFSIQSIGFGISDYLIKEELTPENLYKSITYSIERKKINRRLRESEERFSSLFHRSPQPMWVYDPESLKFVQVNKAAIDHYGYTEEEFLHMTILDIRPSREFQRTLDQVRKIRICKDPVLPSRFKHIKKSGELIDVEIYSSEIVLDEKVYRSVIAIDITEKLRWENRMTKAIIKTQEDERYEIGSELHDNVCQILASTQMFMSMLKPHLTGKAADLLQQCSASTALAFHEIRSLSHRLAPAFFEQTNFQEAVNILAREFAASNSFDIQVHIDECIKEMQLSRDLQLNLYRICQEQVRNIAKYAQATRVIFSLESSDETLKMIIRDNGVGFDVQKVKKGIGLSNIKRRAELFEGSMSIETTPSNGCTLTVSIPLKSV